MQFPVLFKAYFIFKDFSRKPSKFKFFSSRCEPWKCFKNQMRDFKNLGGKVTDGHTLAMDRQCENSIPHTKFVNGIKTEQDNISRVFIYFKKRNWLA